MSIRNAIWFAGGIGIHLILLGCLSTSTYATSFSWNATTITASRAENKPSPYAQPPQGSCVNQMVSVGNNFTQDAACVYQGDGFDYAFVERSIPTWWGGASTDRFFAIRFAGDQKMYRVQNISPNYYDYVYVAHSKNLVFSSYVSGSPWARTACIIKDLPSKLSKGVGADLAPEYRVKEGSADYLIQDEKGGYIPTRTISVSPNGQWLAAEIEGRGLVKVNLSDFTYHWYSAYRASYGYGSDGSMEFAITNDGKRVAVAGLNISPQVAELDDTCGLRGVKFLQSWYVGASNMTPCPELQLSGYLHDTIGDYVRVASHPTFDYEGGELQVYAEPYYRSDVEYKPGWVTLKPAGYQSSQLAYLALGDSYSSGEGDVDKDGNGETNHYLPHTDEGKDNCHISSRSYPFLLRDQLGVPNNQMKSVACSGARVVFDYNRGLMGYQGQGGRLSQENDIASLQSDALTSFMPGYVPQLEFVKKYKPRAVTLTGGGNDVGFANIIAYCANLSMSELVVDGTCGYAVANSDLRKMLGRAIYDQYSYTIRLINAIKQASPTTIINIISYPSFIAGSTSTCALNSGFLDGEERDMVNEGVSYMNKVLEQASMETGVNFINIQDSLVGGRLCEGSRFVTGVSDIGYDLAAKRQEVFHPNAKGHQKIASTIASGGAFSLTGIASSIMSSSLVPPAIPAYFGGNDAAAVQARQDNILETSQVSMGDFVTLNLPSNTLEPGSTITVAMYSNPIDIGKYRVSDEGAAKIQFKLPEAVHIGKHVITVTGSSYSGEPLQLYQFMEVASLNPDDKDGDGIKDIVDRCQYVAHYYDETTGKDICSAHLANGARTSQGPNEGGLVAKNDGVVLSSKASTTAELPSGSKTGKIEGGQGAFSLKIILPIIVLIMTGSGLIIRRIYEKNRV